MLGAGWRGVTWTRSGSRAEARVAWLPKAKHGRATLLSRIARRNGRSAAPNARPSGGVVTAGSATIGATSSTTTVSQSSQWAAINWHSFDVGAHQTVDFVQPSASAMALNRVISPNPSQIAGRIDANGQIILINQSALGGDVCGRSGRVRGAGQPDGDRFGDAGRQRNDKWGANLQRRGDARRERHAGDNGERSDRLCTADRRWCARADAELGQRGPDAERDHEWRPDTDHDRDSDAGRWDLRHRADTAPLRSRR